MAGDIVVRRARRHEPGAVSKRTPEREAIILSQLEEGKPKQAACGSAGITADTLNQWIDSDPDLAERVEVAMCRGESALLGKIIAAGEDPRQWTANAWLLERTRQNRYALRQKAVIDGGVAALPLALAEEIRRRLSGVTRPELPNDTVDGVIVDDAAPATVQQKP